jgi:hypothetical protein
MLKGEPPLRKRLTFEQASSEVVFESAPWRALLRCSVLFFDNELHWVNAYKAEQACYLVG